MSLPSHVFHLSRCPSLFASLDNHRLSSRKVHEEKPSRSRSVDSSSNLSQPSNAIVSSSTDSAVYSMSDLSSSITQPPMKKPSQSLKDISHLFHYFTLSNSNSKQKSQTLTHMRRKKLRKKLTHETFAPTTHPREKTVDGSERRRSSIPSLF